MKKLKQIIKEGQWDKPLGLSHDVESFKKRGQDFMDPVSKRKFEAAAETAQDPQSREQLFSLGTRFIHRALARNPNLTPPEIQQLLSLNDPDINESLEELYGEQSEQVTEANQDMGKVVFDQQTSVIADYLTQRVPEPEIINILVKKHKMDPQRAEVLLQSAKNMIRSGH